MPILLAETGGVMVLWIVLTFLVGRVYCSSVCPVGCMLDVVGRFRRFIPGLRDKVFRYNEANGLRYIFFAVYLVLLVLGLTGVALIVDPWMVFSNCTGALGSGVARGLWSTYGLGVLFGIIVGILSLAVLVPGGLFFGRDFCNSFCPLGLGLSLVGSRSVVNIVIDPDRCTGCMRCEWVCKSSCINVAGRYVDNSRCIRCFNCTDVCVEDAIRLRGGIPRAGTPLMRRTTRTQ